MATDTHELVYKLFEELGITDRDPRLAEQLEEHFSKIVTEVLIRRLPESEVDEVKKRIDEDDPNLSGYITQVASQIPGLGDEIEEALMRE